MNSSIFDQIKSILKSADDIIAIKSEIVNTIYNIFDDLCRAADKKISVKKRSPDEWFKTHGYGSSDEIIIIYNTDDVNVKHRSILMFGYSINQSTGYPVIFQTRTEDFTVFDEPELIDFILERIGKLSVRIMEIANMDVSTEDDDSDIPF